uniref:EGF-like domain-containing protein n=1 Tax=Cyprinus carpio carpio TaxID=630221 RepID=A0A9J8AAR0_CYPCA
TTITHAKVGLRTEALNSLLLFVLLESFFNFLIIFFLIDIDECLFSPSVCGPDSICINEIGSYNCSCLNGFTATNPSLTVSINNTCTDIDECLFSPSVCGPDSICTNEIGSYNCSCLDGFTATNSSLPISINNTCRGTFYIYFCVYYYLE